ncbi:MAG: ATP-binding cassette transporter [Candidatus Magnetoglobus multicellularis str. Araruama]|uniref:ATP-binding cassette transporter n=1 Tax=Candidatus Magnetoglobus multicellularis str. Araruama TaxID=890399 RepID=A0A1V1PH30_9BACT|nr:MAG: ATP-binding cassette transporter [Candidatus Magnetoglobus multicellularis str. Araruama]
MKKIIQFINKNSDIPYVLIISLMLFSGFSYAIILSIINTAETIVSKGENHFQTGLFSAFVLLLAFYIPAKKMSQNRMIALSQDIVKNIRLNILGKIRHAELQFIEETGLGLIYARLTEDTKSFSQSAPTMIMALESTISLTSILCYIFSQSFSAFVLVVLLLSICFMIYYSAYIPAREKIKLARQNEAKFFERLKDVLYGIKEIRVSYQKNEELFEDVKGITRETKKLKVHAQISLNGCFIIINSTYLMIICTIVFVFPMYTDISKEQIISLISALLFAWGPIMVIFRSIISFMTSAVSKRTTDQYRSFHWPKKRLAYIMSLLENKPIYVFDEWAADQDPNFRKLFYDNFFEQYACQG